MGWLYRSEPIDDPLAYLKAKLRLRHPHAPDAGEKPEAPLRRLSRNPLPLLRSLFGPSAAGRTLALARGKGAPRPGAFRWGRYQERVQPGS
jgi:hypothetical protein